MNKVSLQCDLSGSFGENDLRLASMASGAAGAAGRCLAFTQLALEIKVCEFVFFGNQQALTQLT